MSNLQKIKNACTNAGAESKMVRVWKDNRWQSEIETFTLADVLLAINSGPKWPETWFITTSGFFFNGGMVGGGDKAMAEIQKLNNPKWNLKDDNLEHQSEETINLIAGLL